MNTLTHPSYSLLPVLQQLQEIANALGLADLEQKIAEAHDDLVARPMALAVVGAFKRGKSTFINALLGERLLPAGVRPCSAAPTRIMYGEKREARVFFKADAQRAEKEITISLSELEEYVTKWTPEAERRAAQIKEVVISHPSAFGNGMMALYDTPGLNDDEEMTAVTLELLPHVAGVLFVIMPESPFSEIEGDFLYQKLLLQDQNHILFVVNAIDRIRTDEERERVLTGIRTRIKDAIESRLAKQFGTASSEYSHYRQQLGEPQLLGLSSYQALQAKETQNRPLLQKSGFPALEQQLEHFCLQSLPPAKQQQLHTLFTDSCHHLLTTLEKQAQEIEQQQTLLQHHYTHLTPLSPPKHYPLPHTTLSPPARWSHLTLDDLPLFKLGKIVDETWVLVARIAEWGEGVLIM